MNLVEKFFDFINRNNVHTNTNTVTSENEKSNNTKKNEGIKDIEKFRFLVGRVNELMSEHNRKRSESFL